MFTNMLTVFATGSLYIVTSAGMIVFNKYLVHEDRFPYPAMLVFLHCGLSSMLALLLFLVKPSAFPSLTSATEKVPFDKDLVLKGALPIAFLFSAQLILANTAYLYSSMSFLQMMKEANLVLVFGMSLFMAQEAFSWLKVRIVVMIVVATSLTIHGEINFSLLGFVIQGSGQFFECARIVLQAMLLSTAGRKLDVLTYVLLVMPLCFAVLGSVLLALASSAPLEHLKLPHWSELRNWWPLLLANASLAFALNCSIALFMKNSSAVAFILAGIAKDAMIVLAGVLVLHEPISALQSVAFFAQLVLIFTWSAAKTFPDKFKGGIVNGMFALVYTVPAAEQKLCNPPLDAEKAYGIVQEEKEQ